VLIHPTGGTAGRPRLVPISSAGLVAAWAEFLGSVAPDASDTFVVDAPIHHVTGHAVLLLLPLLFGAVAHFPEHAAAVDEAVVDVSPTLSVALPQRWQTREANLQARVRESAPLNRWVFNASLGAARHQLAAQASDAEATGRGGPGALLGRWIVLRPVLRQLGLRRLRAAWVGGRYVPPELLEYWRALGVPLAEFYGATEAGGLIAFQTTQAAAAGSRLDPLSSLQVRIDDGGQIEVSGPSVSPTDLDGRRAGGSWFATGDRGSLDPEGAITLSYRISDAVRLGGKEVPIGETERLLRATGYVRHVAVIGRDRPYLTALIDPDLAAVAAWARANSVRYGSLDSLARTPQVIDQIGEAVTATNKRLAERGLPEVRNFAVLGAAEGFENTDVLALTGEVRRGEVEKRYAAIVESMYAGDTSPDRSHPKSEAKA
jgi:long-chain acyl-CoA synthetase